MFQLLVLELMLTMLLLMLLVLMLILRVLMVQKDLLQALKMDSELAPCSLLVSKVPLAIL